MEKELLRTKEDWFKFCEDFIDLGYEMIPDGVTTTPNFDRLPVMAVYEKQTYTSDYGDEYTLFYTFVYKDEL